MVPYPSCPNNHTYPSHLHGLLSSSKPNVWQDLHSSPLLPRSFMQLQAPKTGKSPWSDSSWNRVIYPRYDEKKFCSRVGRTHPTDVPDRYGMQETSHSQSHPRGL